MPKNIPLPTVKSEFTPYVVFNDVNRTYNTQILIPNQQLIQDQSFNKDTPFEKSNVQNDAPNFSAFMAQSQDIIMHSTMFSYDEPIKFDSTVKRLDSRYSSDGQDLIDNTLSTLDNSEKLAAVDNREAVSLAFGHLSEGDQERLTEQLEEMELRAVIVSPKEEGDSERVIFVNASKDPFAGSFEFKPQGDDKDLSDGADSEPVLVGLLSSGALQELDKSTNEQNNLSEMIETTIMLAEQRKAPPVEGLTDFAPSAEAAIELSKTGRALSDDQLRAVASTGVISFSSKELNNIDSIEQIINGFKDEFNRQSKGLSPSSLDDEIENSSIEPSPLNLRPRPRLDL